MKKERQKEKRKRKKKGGKQKIIGDIKEHDVQNKYSSFHRNITK